MRININRSRRPPFFGDFPPPNTILPSFPFLPSRNPCACTFVAMVQTEHAVEDFGGC